MSTIKKVVKKILPPHTRLGRVAQKTAIKTGLAKPFFVNGEYQKWIDHVEPECFLPVLEWSVEDEPLFSVVVPFFNTPEKYLHPLLDSIINQSYGNWELIVGDASTDPSRSKTIQEASEQDKRIKYLRINRNEGISGNTNQALKMASGKYVVFADHDDTICRHAFNEMAIKIKQDPKTDIIYSDEDKLSDNGKWRHSPYFKPDWSPHLFLYTNYTNHLSTVKRSHIEKVGGLRPDFDGSQDYDLLLRIHSAQKEPLKVVHIPKILYNWREAVGSTAADYSKKSYAFEAGRKALSEYIVRKNIAGVVESIHATPGFYRLVLQPKLLKKVMVIIAACSDTLGNDAIAQKIKAHTKTNLSVVFTTQKHAKYDEADTSLVIVEVNDTALPERADWLDRLVGVLELSDVAAVAPRIVTSSKQRVVDMGIVHGRKGEKIRLLKGNGYKDMTINGGSLWVRDVDELSGAVIAYRAAQGTRKLDNQYYVVWTHVDFIQYDMYGEDTFFNNNLQVFSDGRVSLND